MKIVIIGGSGLIGRKLSALLEQAGHAVFAASPSAGVNSVTGEGLAPALAGAEVVVDVTNSPSFEDEAVMHFFRTSTANLLAASAEAGVRHFVALSVVGAERVPDSGYFRAKVAQEALIERGGVPFTILRATQFFEFLKSIAQAGAGDGTVRLPSAPLQPIAAADVAAALADVACQAPLNGTCEVAGPASFPLDALVRRVLRAGGDPREVVTDPDAPYFGTRLAADSLIAGSQARTGKTSLEAWLAAAPDAR
ncbi:SDR family oxidoreductase [Cupriavidus sp. 30B13]|uniref:SDR family oxidoreductase n=1 Tax=Cupriavidus sp. 30B13 TaxID=3384241 RepID=UPI003B8ECEBB